MTRPVWSYGDLDIVTMSGGAVLSGDSSGHYSDQFIHLPSGASVVFLRRYFSWGKHLNMRMRQTAGTDGYLRVSLSSSTSGGTGLGSAANWVFNPSTSFFDNVVGTTWLMGSSSGTTQWCSDFTGYSTQQYLIISNDLPGSRTFDIDYVYDSDDQLDFPGDYVTFISANQHLVYNGDNLIYSIARVRDVPTATWTINGTDYAVSATDPAVFTFDAAGILVPGRNDVTFTAHYGANIGDKSESSPVYTYVDLSFVPPFGYVDEPVNFVDTSNYGSTGIVPLSRSWAFDVDADETYIESGGTATYTYTSPGTYLVGFLVIQSLPNSSDYTDVLYQEIIIYSGGGSGGTGPTVVHDIPVGQEPTENLTDFTWSQNSASKTGVFFGDVSALDVLYTILANSQYDGVGPTATVWRIYVPMVTGDGLRMVFSLFTPGTPYSLVMYLLINGVVVDTITASITEETTTFVYTTLPGWDIGEPAVIELAFDVDVDGDILTLGLPVPESTTITNSEYLDGPGVVLHSYAFNLFDFLGSLFE